MVIDAVVSAVDSGEEFDRIEARTVPNYAGPAAVRVVHENSLSDIVLGAYTYVDILQVSFINPPIVRVSQGGQGDKVEIVGYGFHDGIVVKAWKSGQPEVKDVSRADDENDPDRLMLYSTEKML